jgi:excinuclease ABC subunit B
LRGLRLGDFDVLVGINLLREGLDLLEVSLVAVLDADQEGFLRSDRSLVQTIGRAARHINGRAILYADRITGSMQRTLDETNRRRAIQAEFNAEHGITPKSVVKSVDQVRFITRVADARLERDEEDGRRGGRRDRRVAEHGATAYAVEIDTEATIAELEKEMKEAAAALEFESAARLRDQLFELKARGSAAPAARRGSLAQLRTPR